MNKLKTLLTWGLLAAATHVMGYTITVSPIEIEAGQSTNLIINLSNTETNLTAYQMSLYMPEGVTVRKEANGKYAYTTNTDRLDPDLFTVLVKDAADGSILIAVFSPNKDVIAGTSGELIRLPIEVASTVTTSLQGSIKNIEFTDVNSQAHKVSDISFNLTYKQSGGDDSPIISFADVSVKALCVANWDINKDGELSEAEAAKMTDLGEVFTNNEVITSFDELQYFTGLKSISNSAFYGCVGLTSLIIPHNVNSIGDWAFSYCENLTSINIPNSVTSINTGVFAGCSGLTSITIGNGVTSIGTSAFAGCSGLTSVTIPNSVTSIGTGAFGLCSGLTSVTIPNSVTSIGVAAFSGCNGLTSITIPDSVTSIESGAFSSCRDLTSIKVEEGNSKYDSRNNCNAIIETATNILIAGCQNTVIPNSVTSISEAAFSGCSDLTSVTIPNSVTSIGASAFSYCSSLTSITIPNSATSIGNWSFSSCTSLTSVTIGNSVTSIGSGAFNNCTSLADVYCLAENIPDTGSEPFEDTTIASATLHVPAGSLNAYRTTAPWSGFGTIVAIEKKGDLNHDAKIDIADAVTILNIMASDIYDTAADLNDDGKVDIADFVTILNIMAQQSVPHKYVDLGLPSGTLWATCNVGANSPEEYGDYFAWGETKPKDGYTFETYKYSNSSGATMTKYCIDSSYGTVDNKTELDPEDDAATTNWGNGWCMPSVTQLTELIDGRYTTTTWTTEKGVYGCKITSKSNGNTLFLPAAGLRDDTELSEAGSYGGYWSRSLHASHTNFAYSLYLRSDDIKRNSYYRAYGFTVRPVRVQNAPTLVTGITLSETSLSLKENETMTLTATVLPENANNKNVTWTSSNESIATVDHTGKVTAVAAGSCIITCSATDGSGVKSECQVTVEKKEDTKESVDLGLPSRTLWATCNVGASSPEEYGDYFAWGETKPKDGYTFETYKYSNSSGTTMTKYCIDSSYGTVDNKTELEPEDDAAMTNWGNGWCMPSATQLTELIDSRYTTATWTTENGVYGCKITSKSNGNTIFLPAAGLRDDTELFDAGSYGGYWSRSLHASHTDFAYSLYLRSDDIKRNSYYRAYGFTVRPVRVQDTPTLVTGITLSATSLSLKENETMTLTATVLPENADNKNVTWESSKPSIAIVDQTGKVTAVAAGSCTITCSATDGSGVKSECQVTVEKKEDTKEYVDLGLPSGTLWATCNVGASSPEEYGDYFAWGETKPKNEYTFETYNYSDSSGATMTKYCIDSSYGTVDNKTELEPEDDAATMKWGNGWCMPSATQLVELIDGRYTTATWTTENGVYGCKITSKSNGNTIFLPAAGLRNDTELLDAGSYGGYWSRSLHASHTDFAYSLYLRSDDIKRNSYYRAYGFTVRPVRVQDTPDSDSIISNPSLLFDFESYYLDESGKYYIWDAHEIFTDGTWKNGNPGFKISKSSAKPMEYPSTPVVGGGPDGSDCVKLETCDTGPFGKMVNMRLASGSMFNGIFDVGNALNDPLKATMFGSPFVHKPVQLRVWARYEPGSVYQDRDGNPVEDGIIDEPDIYIVLFRNEDPSGNKVQPDGNDVLTNPYIVGKGRLPHNFNAEGKDLPGDHPIHGLTNEWQEVIIPIEYTTEPDAELLKNKGYSIIISIASSWQGGFFEGAIGSKLYIDNMRLSYK